MAKRRADIELNRDNWDDDLVSTAKGDFDKADKDVLSQRKILTARTNRNSTGTSGLFKSFTAFSNCSNGNPVSLNFGFTPSVTKANGHKQDDSEYLEHLQTLNQNLLDWITKHIKEDPYCILSPIFSDYNKHLSEINSKFPEHSLVGSATVPEKKEPSGCLATNTSKVTETSVTSVSNSVFIFGNSLSKPITVSSNASNDSTDKKPIFSFGLPPITTSSKFPQSIFHFSGVSNFQPNSDSKQSISNQQENDDDEEYVPPKPEVKDFKEDGSVYSTRCKLFYKVDTEWRERGLGNLFIKPTTNDKFQLLIRADTNLGNILLNILITKDVPIKQQKNNLTLVCIPSPPLPSQGKSSLTNEEGDNGQPKPVPLLIRVKSEEGATQLLSQMDLYRGATTVS
ncbi:Nuclear pore complex protein Nup50 [Schistosoma japonicum]|nr:Nuclear pore complex protein Nup50 [Schistosoma japonicum]